MKLLDKARPWFGWGLLALLLLFIVQNFKSTEIRFLFFELGMPRAFVIFLSAGAGAGALWAFQVYKKLKKPESPSSPPPKP